MNERLKYLYRRYINNECTNEELLELQSLIGNLEHESTISDLLDSQWDNLDKGELNDISTGNADIIYQNIIAQARPKKHGIKPWLRVAAAIVIFLTASLGWYIYRSNNRLPQPVSIHNKQQLNDLAPGGNKARLDLADGSVVALDKVKDGWLRKDTALEITKQNGQLVFIAKSQPLPADTGYNRITTPNGGQFQVVLPDGTLVWLNAGSSLRFPVAFTGRERKVELSGEAYFEVAKNKRSPFKVQANYATIEVLGTHFNVMAYKNESSVNTTLLEGSVKVDNGKYSRTLVPGQQARINDNDIRLYNIDTEEALAWKNGLFEFNSTDLKTIMHQIERWYDVEVRYENDLASKRFTGLISRNTNLSKVLNMLELAGGVHFNIHGKHIIVSR